MLAVLVPVGEVAWVAGRAVAGMNKSGAQSKYNTDPTVGTGCLETVPIVNSVNSGTLTVI